MQLIKYWFDLFGFQIIATQISVPYLFFGLFGYSNAFEILMNAVGKLE